MRQPLLGGTAGTLPTSGTVYTALVGVEGNNADPKFFEAVFPISGTLTNFQVRLSGSPGAGKSYTFTVMVNGSDSTLTVTISETDTTSTLDTSTVSITAGDYVTVKMVASGTPTARNCAWGAEFDSGSGGAIIVGAKGDSSDASDPKYSRLFGVGGGWNATEANVRQVSSVAGNLKNLRVRLTVAPGVATSRVFTVYLNGSPTALTLTIANTDTTGADTTNTVAIVAGDLISLQADRISLATATEQGWGVELDPTTDGESPIMYNITNTTIMSNTATEFSHPCGNIQEVVTTETQVNALATIAFTWKNLYVRLETAPGAGNSLTLSNRVEAGDGALTVTVSGTDQSGNDVSNSNSVTAAQFVCMKSVPVSSPTMGAMSVGSTAFIAVVGGTTYPGYYGPAGYF